MPGWFVCRCACGQGYWCFNRSALDWLDGDTDLPLDEIEGDARVEASRLGYLFVYVDLEPFRLCLCGLLLLFRADAVQVSEGVM